MTEAAILLGLLSVGLFFLAHLLPRGKYDFYSGWGIAVNIIATFAAVAAVVLGIASGANSWERNHCMNVVSQETGMKTKYVDWHGCYITLENGRTVPYERWIEEDED